MFFSQGIDIVDIRRVEKIFKRHNKRFFKKILSNNEIFSINSRNLNKKLIIRKLANKFAVKEATVKALGTGFASGIGFKDIEILNNSDGKPELKFYGNAKKLLDKIKKKLINESFNVSISNEKDYTVAVVTLIFF